MIAVLIVDDHQLTSDALGGLIDKQEDIQVIGVAVSVDEAINKVREGRPDVVVIDLNISDGGIEGTRALKSAAPQIPILAVTHTEYSKHHSQAIRAGARGCLTKKCNKEDLWQAIRDLSFGHPYISPRITQWLSLGRLAGEKTNPFDGLSQRQGQILIGIINGYKNAHIAADLCLSPKTVSNHKTKLFERLEVKSQAELVRLAIEHGLDISPEVIMLRSNPPDLAD